MSKYFVRSKKSMNLIMCLFFTTIFGVGFIVLTLLEMIEFKPKAGTETNNIDGIPHKNLVNYSDWVKFLSTSQTANYKIDSFLNGSEVFETSIPNKIEFFISEQNHNKLLAPKSDFRIKKVKGTVNGTLSKINNLKIRGQSSIMMQRKNLNVALEDFATINGENKIQKKMLFYTLLGLSLDNYYFRNKLSYLLLQKIDLSNSFSTFCEIKINGKSNGIYLLIENPKAHMVDSLKASFIIRRRYEYSSYNDNSFLGKTKSVVKKLIGYVNVDSKFEGVLTEDEVDNYVNQYKQIFNLIQEKSGEELFNMLSQIMDIRQYMRIMAYNFIICNGDYSDELFWYIQKTDTRKVYHFTMWDFDDTLADAPHEGWLLRNSLISDKLIFSVENKLDLAIANDPFLYQKYIEELIVVSESLDHEFLYSAFRKIYTELYPFYSNDEVIKQSESDRLSKRYTLNDLNIQLNGAYSFLGQRIDSIKKILKSR